MDPQGIGYGQWRTGRSCIRADARRASWAVLAGQSRGGMLVRFVRPIRRNVAPYYLSAHYQASIVLKDSNKPFVSKPLFMLYNRKLISVYTRYECLYTTVMVALNIYIGLHYFVALFNQMFKKCIVWNWNTTNLPVILIVLFVYKSSMKQWLLGILTPNQTASAYRGLLEVESWKIPESAEVTMSMNYESRNQATEGRSGEKESEIQEITVGWQWKMRETDRLVF